MDLPGEARFWAKVDFAGPVPEHRPDLGPCWLWTRATDKGGYGAYWAPATSGRAARTVRAHNYGFTLFRELPPGTEPDHLCKVHACVRWSHMEAVTHRVNLLRSRSASALNSAKDRCPQGHRYDMTGSAGERRCRRCEQANDRRNNHKLSGPVVACGCGCGTRFRQVKGYRIRRYVVGHNRGRSLPVRIAA